MIYLLNFFLLQPAFSCSYLSFSKADVSDQLLERVLVSQLAPLVDSSDATTIKFLIFLEELYKKTKEPHEILRSLASVRFADNSSTVSTLEYDGTIVLAKVLRHNPLALAETYRLLFLMSHDTLSISQFHANQRFQIAKNSFAAVYDFIREVYGHRDFEVIDKNFCAAELYDPKYISLSEKPFTMDKEEYVDTLVKEFDTQSAYQTARLKSTVGLAACTYGAAMAGVIGYLAYACFR